MLTIYQDGNCFYSNERGFIAQAPFKVGDYDVEAAEQACAWFVAEMRRQGVQFRFEHDEDCEDSRDRAIDTQGFSF